MPGLHPFAAGGNGSAERPLARALPAEKLFDVLVHLGEGKDVGMGLAEKEAPREFDPAFV